MPERAGLVVRPMKSFPFVWRAFLIYSAFGYLHCISNHNTRAAGATVAEVCFRYIVINTTEDEIDLLSTCIFRVLMGLLSINAITPVLDL